MQNNHKGSDRRRYAVLVLIGMAIMLCGKRVATAQRIDFTYKTWGIEVDGDNVLQNAGHLDNFFGRLYQLQQTGERSVSIVHIGDSHVQADYMTSIIRRNFHKHFGNAGRGLIVPLRVAKTNEPNNYKTQSNAIWRSKRCVFPDQPLPIGIGGVTIQTLDPNATLDIYMNDLWLDYSFNTLTLFHEKGARAFGFNLTKVDGRPFTAAVIEDSGRYSSTIRWDEKVNAVRLHMLKEGNASGATIFGAVLENAMPGVLYHTIGVNGAKFKHYTEAKYFVEQTTALRPDLFIISLGTNESIDYPYVDKNFFGQIDSLISRLKKENPDASFVLATPQDAFREKNKVNPGIMQIRELIIRYAVENGLAFYDMFRAMGGRHSASAWSENALLSKDGIHLTRDGYEYQGNLFYHAIMKSYNLYVLSRHQ